MGPAGGEGSPGAPLGWSPEVEVARVVRPAGSGGQVTKALVLRGRLLCDLTKSSLCSTLVTLVTEWEMARAGRACSEAVGEVPLGADHTPASRGYRGPQFS